MTRDTPTDKQLPLVVIYGPTASGKTSLTIELAKRFNGEIISADSRTIYKGMNIGTAKPSVRDRLGVPHWGFDVVDPTESFSVADFQTYARTKITEIRSRGHIPFLVGGTGLYIDSIVFSYEFGPPADPVLRAHLNTQTLEQLHEYSKINNISLPENEKNKRYVIRSIENANSVPARHATPLDNSIIVGIATDKEVLRSRIDARTEQLFEDGVVDEAIKLGNKYGWDNPAMTSNIYPIIHHLQQNELSLDEAKKKNSTMDWRLAKRQMTWLRRNSFIQWFSLSDAKKFISDHLADHS